MAITKLIQTSVQGTNTITGLDTTGATLLIIISAYWTNLTEAASDNKGNTWHSLTEYGTAGGSSKIRIWYAYDHGGSALSVGSGHNFTITLDAYESMCVLAFSGTDSTSAVYQASSDFGAYVIGEKTLQPGSVAPATAGDVIVSAWASGDGQTEDPAIDLSFVKQSSPSGSNISIASGYLITSNTDAKNPTWTMDEINSWNHAVCIAIFKALAGSSSIGPSGAIATGEGLGTSGMMVGHIQSEP